MFKDFFSEPYRPDFKSNTWVFWKNKLENSWLKIKPATFKVAGSSDRDRIRTCDLLIRSELLYPTELRDHWNLNVKNKNFKNFKTDYYYDVGVAGFEPATSCSQSRRDDRATLHPEKSVRKYNI